MKQEVKNGIVLAFCVILIIIVVYFATAVFFTGEIGNNKTKKTTTTENSEKSSYDNKIIASKILDRTEETYMVVIFSNKESSNELKDAISKYKGDTKLYVVNLDEPLNKSIKSDTDNLSVTNISDLKVKENALITVSNHQVISSVFGGANIISSLK